MTANIFKELLKYASYTEKTPRENIFTGSFVYLLKENANLKNYFVAELIKLYKNTDKQFSPPRIPIKELLVSTQTSHRRHMGAIDNRRDQIDVEIGDKKGSFGIFIENKIDAPLGVKQDIRYRRSLDQNYIKGILVFITLSGSQPIKKDIKHIQLRWAEIYDIFQKYLKKERNKISWHLLSNFLEYMKEENMASFEGLTKSDSKGNQWRQSYVLQDKLETVLLNIMNYLKDNGYKKTSFKNNNDTIYHGIVHESISSQPRKHKRWKRNSSSVGFGIYPYFPETMKKWYDASEKKGLRAFVEVWSKTLRNPEELKRILKRKSIKYYTDPHYFDMEIDLGDLIGQTTNSKEQEKRMRDFYFKSLEALRRAGVFKMLCR